ncbi:MAG TPA: hypothetical protein VFD43_05880, partial [Planctomycetota bacterium]|nr:hypothetical protein [Planctomycetota bacterium]
GVALGDGVAIVGNTTGPFSFEPCWAYELGPGGWAAAAALPPDELTNLYGAAVGIWGDTAVVGGQDLNDADVAAYVFERVGGAWAKSAKLFVPGSAWQLSDGMAVAIEGDTIVVASPYYYAVHVFERSGGAWSLTQSIAPTPGSGFGNYGWSLSLRGGRLVIGGCAVNAGVDCVGTAWIYERQAGVFVETAQLLTSGGDQYDLASLGLAQSGDTIVLGAPGLDLGYTDMSIGGVFVFEFDGASWSQTALLTAPAPDFDDHFGNAVALQDDVLVVGAFRSDDLASNAGAVFVYHREGRAWTLLSSLYADEPVANAHFGRSLALSGDTLMIGAGANSGQNDDRVHVLRGVPGLADWTPVGGAVAGVAGTPCAFGSGPPAVGQAATVTLTGALPAAPGWLVLGLQRLNAPFKGGVLVPAPELLLPLATDGQGGHSFSWSWPAAAPPGLELWLQHWVVDAGGPSGLSAGNGLHVDVP